MIRSLDFYQFIHQRLKTFSQLTQVTDEVKKIESNRVTTLEKEYNSDLIFSSILDPKKLFQQKKYPVLQQHFLGQIIETKNNCFDPDTVSYTHLTLPTNREV